MNIPQNIQNMVDGSEQINVEYKESPKDDKITDTIMAFANRQGGHLLIGVKDSTKKDEKQYGEIKGFISGNIDKVRQSMENKAADLRPPATLLINKDYPLGNGSILLHLEVQEHAHKPIGTQGGRFLIRTHTGNRGMEQSDLRRLILNEERALINLRVRIHKNNEHAQSVLASTQTNFMPATVFEKLAISMALANIDIYHSLDESTLTGLYQDYEIIDYAKTVLITAILENQAHVGSNSQNNPQIYSHKLEDAARDLIKNHCDEVLRKSELLIALIDKRLDEINQK